MPFAALEGDPDLSVCQHCGATNAPTAVRCQRCHRALFDNPTAYLATTSGALAGRKFYVEEDGLRVGRTPQSNHLVIDDSEISRAHARLLFENGQLKLVDSSVNGVYVNGQRVTETHLKAGDQVRFGLSPANTFKVYFKDSASAAAAASSPAVGAPPAPPPVAPQREPKPSPKSGHEDHGTLMASVPVEPRRMPTLLISPDEMLATKRKLQLILDQYAVKDIPLEGERIEIGREAREGAVYIDHPSVSVLQAEIIVGPDDRAKLRDLQSLNGTFVNGERITDKVLEDGDLIQLGACETHLLMYRESRRRSLMLREDEFKKPVTKIGREPGADIHFDHPTVSSLHAEVLRGGDGYEIVDKGSTNGTFINGQRITRQRLEPHDRITVGAVQLVFDGSHLEQRNDGTRIKMIARGLKVEVADHTTGKALRLLDEVSIAVDPCEFVGLLGPSGAGKSTFMDALNGSRPAQNGTVQLNGQDLYTHFAELRAQIGYLPQEDILHRQLTVRECLYYSARLRLPDDYSEKEIWRRVDEVIKQLDLSERATQQISDLSGGQRKRVSLGIELLNKPALLFVDEPTAGQDPRTEMKMMRLFREIANRGSTIIINTHLLGSFSLLDKVAVLVRGKMAYYGPSQEMLPYFKASRPHEVFDKLQEQTPDVWAQRYKASELCAESITRPLADESTSKRSAHEEKKAPVKPKPRSLLRQFNTLLSRQATLKLKEVSTLLALLLPPVVIAILMGFMKDGPNEPKTLFMMIMVALWFGCSASVREIVDELPVYKRERQRDLSMLSYLGAKLVWVAGVALVQSALFIGVLTALGGIENHLGEAFLLVWLMTLEGGLIGLLISAFFSSAEKALYAFPLSMIPQLLLAGILMPVTTVEPILPKVEGTHITLQKWPEALPQLHGMSAPLRYGLSPLMVGRWGLEALTDLYIHDNQPYSYALLNNVAVTLHPQDTATARALIEKINQEGPGANGPLPGNSLPQYLGILGGFVVVMVGGTAFALKRKEG